MVDGDVTAMVLQSVCELCSNGGWRRNGRGVIERP